MAEHETNADGVKGLIMSLHLKVDGVQRDVNDIKITQATQAEQIKTVASVAGEAKDIALRGYADESDRRAIREMRRRTEGVRVTDDEEKEGRAALRYIYLIGGVVGLLCTVVAAITGIIALTGS